MKTIVFILLFSTPVYAQTHTTNQKVWNVISWVSAGTQIGLDSYQSLKSDNKKREFLQQGIRIGTTSLLTRITKHYVHKERPDGTSNDSFFSGHAAQSADAMFWNLPAGKKGFKFQVSIPLAAITALGRVEGKRHDWVDVTVGSIVGSTVGALTERFVK